jgi:hypothetical protein
MHPLRIAVLFFALPAFSVGQTPVPPASGSSAARLPVTRVILYKNGVGYFEHSGHVRGSQDVNVDFTTAQLNDVLKSLTVLDRGKGRITGVSYNSTAPIERQLGLLRLPVGENPTTAQFLAALRGARVEIHNGSATGSGRLLSIEERDLPKTDPSREDREEQPGPGEKTKHTQISIVSDVGELRVFDLMPATSVRVLEKDVNEEVGKYLGLIASTRDQDVRRMTISTAGDGERDLLVSYISEVPVWKSTYRIVVPKEGKPLLQGWAIVDNTVGEDWKNVELSLVAGAPQSFVQELSQPYYSRRPEVPLPENAMLTPQTHEATLEQYAKLQSPARIVTGVVGGVPGGVPGGSMGGVVGGRAAGSGGGMGAEYFDLPHLLRRHLLTPMPPKSPSPSRRVRPSARRRNSGTFLNTNSKTASRSARISLRLCRSCRRAWTQREFLSGILPKIRFCALSGSTTTAVSHSMAAVSTFSKATHSQARACWTPSSLAKSACCRMPPISDSWSTPSRRMKTSASPGLSSSMAR